MVVKKPSVWLPDKEYREAVRELTSSVGTTLAVFDIYGMGNYIPEATHAIVKAAEDFGLKLRGVPKKIAVKKIDK